jgi:hypothetical protein
MNRRDIVVGLLCSATLLGRAHAQQTGKIYRMAFISPNVQPSEMSEGSLDQALARVWGVFFGELRRLGYVEGKNLVFRRGTRRALSRTCQQCRSSQSGPHLHILSRYAARVQSSNLEHSNRRTYG